MFCMYCGKEIPDKSKFCQYCGKPSVTENTSNEASQNLKGLTLDHSPEVESQVHHTNHSPQDSYSNFQQQKPGPTIQQGIVCPRCGSANIKIERFTWWGGVLGATFANRMVCKDCGNKFKLQSP